MRRPLILGLLAAAVVLPALAVFLSGTLESSPCRGEVSDPGASPPHHDPELEDRIPDGVAGQGTEMLSLCANVAEPGGITTAPEFLDDVGVHIDDVTYTAINPSIGAEPHGGVVTAYRYRGASEDEIRDAYVAAMTDLGDTIVNPTLAGKDVQVSEGPMSPGVMAYVADDTLYFVSGTDDECRELLAQLP